jgi:hypothetical protein
MVWNSGFLIRWANKGFFPENKRLTQFEGGVGLYMTVCNVLSGQEQDYERVVEVPGNENGSDVGTATHNMNVGE